ncbi:MAG TPA: 2-C-methyl-D-erythritol 4-phosphate cytidylyltransferase, partial [Candidatus Cloacimonadota bacterium]|nr:2-C-methyl-D-erythritol 4-phosphate cytidylyltransferase [Candidatus Cloacimonadota bacterium]
QTFAFDMIYDLHDKAKKEGLNLTDDAGLCEYYGIPVFYQLCSSYNIKITNPEDSAIANAIMRELYNKGDVRCV